MVSHLAYDLSARTLICTSVGGPVTHLVWSKDGSNLDTQDTSKYRVLQEVVDSEEGTYRSTLTLIDKSSTDSGSYECRVRNIRNAASLTITVSGETYKSNYKLKLFYSDVCTHIQFAEMENQDSLGVEQHLRYAVETSGSL